MHRKNRLFQTKTYNYLVFLINCQLHRTSWRSTFRKTVMASRGSSLFGYLLFYVTIFDMSPPIKKVIRSAFTKESECVCEIGVRCSFKGYCIFQWVLTFQSIICKWFLNILVGGLKIPVEPIIGSICFCTKFGLLWTLKTEMRLCLPLNFQKAAAAKQSSKHH
jgi:hypothetical protein